MTRPSLPEHLSSTVPGDLARLIELLAFTVMDIGTQLRHSPRAQTGRSEAMTNPSGDVVHRLDLVAHDRITEALSKSPNVGCFASEEAVELLQADATETGQYCVVFDPLDGSNNLDSNGPVACIFGIFPRQTPTGTACSEGDVLRPGTDLVAAGYALFGASSQFVLSTGNGVSVFQLDADDALRLSQTNLRIPDPGRSIFSVNDGHAHKWDARVRDYVETLRRGGYTARYVGTMAADVHRLLCHGGIYMHPADTTGPTPRGKLRLLFEAQPLGFLLEDAGGVATDGQSAILETVPESLHEQIPVVFGSQKEVARFLEFATS